MLKLSNVRAVPKNAPFDYTSTVYKRETLYRKRQTKGAFLPTLVTWKVGFKLSHDTVAALYLKPASRGTISGAEIRRCSLLSIVRPVWRRRQAFYTWRQSFRSIYLALHTTSHYTRDARRYVCASREARAIPFGTCKFIRRLGTGRACAFTSRDWRALSQFLMRLFVILISAKWSLKSPPAPGSSSSSTYGSNERHLDLGGAARSAVSEAAERVKLAVPINEASCLRRVDGQDVTSGIYSILSTPIFSLCYFLLDASVCIYGLL